MQLDLRVKRNDETILTINSQWQQQTKQLTGKANISTASLLSLLDVNNPLPFLSTDNSELIVDLQFNLLESFGFSTNEIKQVNGKGAIRFQATTQTNEASIMGHWQLKQGDISVLLNPNLQWHQPTTQSSINSLSANLTTPPTLWPPPEKITFGCKTPLEITYKLNKQHTNMTGECQLELLHSQYQLQLSNQLEGINKLSEWYIYTIINGELVNSTGRNSLFASRLTNKILLTKNSLAFNLVDSAEASLSNITINSITTDKTRLLVKQLSGKITPSNNPIENLKFNALFDVAIDRPTISGQKLAPRLISQHQISITNQLADYHGNWQLGPIASFSNQLQWKLNEKKATTNWLLDIKSLEKLAKPLSSLVPNWPNQLIIQKGLLTNKFSGSIFFTPLTISGTTNVAIKQASLLYGETQVNNINSKVQLNIQKNQLSTTNAFDNSLTMDRIKAGIPVESISSQLQFSANLEQPDQTKVKMKQLKANLLGGTITAPTFSLIPFSNQETQITIKALDLAKLVALEQQPTITASGKIDGHLPIEIINNKPSIKKGTLQSPGTGWIKVIKHPSTSTLQSSSESLGLALSALENFHYDQLSSDVQLKPNGDLTLYVKLAGKNPDFYQGKRIHFNYKQEENIYMLIKSIQLGQYIGENITEKLQQPSRD